MPAGRCGDLRAWSTAGWRASHHGCDSVCGRFHLLFDFEVATMNTASDRLIELVQELGAVIPQTAASEDDLLQIREYITHCSQPGTLDEWFWNFLTGILRADSYDGKIIHVFGAKTFIKHQENLDQLPAHSGFVQFAYWAGDSDGDAWVFDSQYRCIRCISPQLMIEDSEMAQIRAYSYGVFFNYNAFPSFLRGVSHDRKTHRDI
jgi:hypothetical protein